MSLDGTYDAGNIFGKILRGEIPCHKVYEDADAIVFMDVMPQADGHTLVIPKERKAMLLGTGITVLGIAFKPVDSSVVPLAIPIVAGPGAMATVLVTTHYLDEAEQLAEAGHRVEVTRAAGKPVIMASAAGGMDIEEVAAKTPEKIHKVFIDPATGLTDRDADDVARNDDDSLLKWAGCLD